MNISPIRGNVNFGKIYAVHGPKEKAEKLEAVLSTKNAQQSSLAYMDITHIYSNLYAMRSLRDVALKNAAEAGESIGLLFTEKDARDVNEVSTLNEEEVSVLCNKDSEMINLNDDMIFNFF